MMRKSSKFLFVDMTLILIMMLVACRTETTATPVDAPQTDAQVDQPSEDASVEETVAEETPIHEPTTEVPATDAPPPDTPEPTEVPAAEEPEEKDAGPLPAEPQEISFQAEDGTELMGRYYPGAANPAPMVILMHWAPGDMEDWNEIAFWLQNRGLGGTSPNVGSAPWLDPGWFPPLWEESSYAVFTFSFRECDGGCQNFSTNRSLWLLDAVAAVETARQLDGIDPLRVVALGASIGADGAVDGCFYPGSPDAVRCESALSLSPGNYLTVNYADAVTWADEAGKPVNCYYAAGDAEASQACQSANGVLYSMFEWSSDPHGMMLLQPEIEPSAMQMIIDWLGIIFES